MLAKFAPPDPDAIPIRLVGSDTCADFLSDLPEAQAAWAQYHGFAGHLGSVCILPDPTGAPAGVLVGQGTDDARARQRFAVGDAIGKLPRGSYALDPAGAEADWGEVALGYLLSLYRFDRYTAVAAPQARLVAPETVDAPHLERIAAAEFLTRDLINTPAEDMGPAALEDAARRLADTHQARIEVTRGDDLLAANLPLIHTVGRASDEAPRLIDLRWGEAGPQITLVGKGVCFDTGGLNLKPGASMALMKKDMGGAANALGLARMILSADLPVRLRVLIPAVENAVSGASFRPGDVFTARNGKSVEINNTDAEGRLVLADALALAAEESPDLLISVATLTGAARVALGPDIAPFFTDSAELAQDLETAAHEVWDPVWRLPFHAPYERLIEPQIADLDNAPKGGFAGAITAALFLRRFAEGVPRYLHFDIYAWQPAAAPARAVGGVGQGMRALFEVLRKGMKT